MLYPIRLLVGVCCILGLFVLTTHCAIFRAVEQAVETTLSAHQVLLKEAIRFGTRELLILHPELAPGIIAWADRVRTTIQPTGWSLDALEPVLLGTLGVDGWGPGMRELMEEGIQGLLWLTEKALMQMEPQPKGLVLTAADIAGWMSEVAKGQ